ncbi:MAG TPA: AI-2E family transporter [Candidatus Methylomirabilis sp.]|jgi:predicted PurR-regulated permease PerM|nr:AI-2E family transporter [Candidatus Methylomirabilis sp.]
MAPLSRIFPGPLLTLVALGAAGWVLYRLRGLLGLLLLATLLAYVLDPAVSALSRWGLPRGTATLLLALALLAAAGLTLVLMVPALWDELLLARQRLPEGLAALERVLRPWLMELTGRDLPVSAAEWVREGMVRAEALIPHGLSLLREFVVGTFSGLVAFILNLLALTVVPLFTYYLLRDFPVLLARAQEALPGRYRERVVELAREVDGILRAFFRGQLTICALVGGTLAVGLFALGVDLALLLGFLSGAAILIPYVGYLLATAVVLLVTWLQGGTGTQFLGVAGLYGAVATVEAFVVSPRVVGGSVGLPPAFALLAVLAGGNLFGFWGILLAVPGAAVAKVLAREGLRAWQSGAAGREEGA